MRVIESEVGVVAGRADDLEDAAVERAKGFLEIALGEVADLALSGPQ